MKDTPWILVDTETTGIRPPIFVVEIGAQRMRGWEPEGPPFQRLLNQNRDIPPEAARVHGYTREILERDGGPAEAVYEAFAEYAGELPLVAYNLQYDLDQVLRPEWKRLGISQIGGRGFCALRLAQRLLDPVPAGNCKLQTLRQYYRLPQRGAHTALGDVETVVDLLGQVLRPLAEQRGLDSWQSVCDFTTQDWYPTRIAFGAFKGRLFWDAETDATMHGWLVRLSHSTNRRNAASGRWYLSQLAEGKRPDTILRPTEANISNGNADDALNIIHSRDADRQEKTGTTSEEAAAKRRAEWNKNPHLNRIDRVLKEKWTLFPPSVRVEMWGTIEEPQNRPEGSLLAYLGALVWAVELVGPEMIGERSAEVLGELYLMYSLPPSPPFSIMSCVESFANFLMYSLSQPSPPLEESGEEWKEEWVEEVVDGLQAVDNQRELAEELAWGLAALLSYEPVPPWGFLD